MLQKNTFMGVETTIDLVALRAEAQKEAEDVTLREHWHSFWHFVATMMALRLKI